MSSDVCESWEDILKEETLSKRVERIQLNGSDSNDGDVNSLENSTKTVLENGNQLKLLKRNKKSNRKLLDLDIGGSLSDSNALNARRNVQVLLEENSSTTPFNSTVIQASQVKILQRPKTDSGQATNGSGLYSNRNGTLSLKTFQEREAEYAKARLRIMGSAVPNYDEKNQLRSSLLSPMNTATPVVKEESVSRPPQGPPLVGGRGFGIRR